MRLFVILFSLIWLGETPVLHAQNLGVLQPGIHLLDQDESTAAYEFFKEKFDRTDKPSVDLALYYCESQLRVINSPAQHYASPRYDMLSILPSVIEQSGHPEKVRKARLLLAKYYAKLGLRKEANKLFQLLLEENQQDPHLWLAIADNFSKRADQEGIFRVYSNLRQAREAYSNALKLAPTDQDILWQIALFTASADPAYGGNKRQALKYLNLLEEHSESARKVGLADNKRAQIFQQLNRKKKALSYIARALEKEMDYFNTLYAIRINAELGYFERAFEIIEEAQEKLPLFKREWMYQEARTHILSKTNLDKAIVLLEAYKREMEVAPVGWQFDDRSWQFLQGLEVFHWRLATAYDMSDNLVMARHYYQTSLAINPDFKPAADALLRLD